MVDSLHGVARAWSRAKSVLTRRRRALATLVLAPLLVAGKPAAAPQPANAASPAATAPVPAAAPSAPIASELPSNPSDEQLEAATRQWLLSDDYQRLFELERNRGRYPINVRGKAIDGQNRWYAQQWIGSPHYECVFIKNNLSPIVFARRNRQLIGLGYTTISRTSFVRADGTTGVAATWTKPQPAGECADVPNLPD